MTPTTDLQRTPLFETHVASKAKMVDFGGWNMPVQYSGIVDEHNAVRNYVGLFDVSHMGEIIIRGPQSAQLVDYVSTNNAAKLKIGQAHYSALLYDHGVSSTTSWSTKSATLNGFCASTLRIRTKISNTSAHITTSKPKWKTPVRVSHRSPGNVPKGRPPCKS